MTAALLLAIGLIAASGSSIDIELSQSHRFDCDTPAGHLSQWDMTLPRKQASVSGSINFWEARPGTDWLPVAAVLLRDAEQERQAGLRMVWNEERKTFLIDLVQADGEINIEAVAEQPTNEPPFAFRIIWVGGDSIVIVLGDKAYELALDFEPRVVALSCTSGGAIFNPIQLVL